MNHADQRRLIVDQFTRMAIPFAELPAHTSPRDLTVFVISALVLSTLAGAIPAIVAARLKPVEALRNE